MTLKWCVLFKIDTGWGLTWIFIFYSFLWIHFFFANSRWFHTIEIQRDALRNGKTISCYLCIHNTTTTCWLRSLCGVSHLFCSASLSFSRKSYPFLTGSIVLKKKKGKKFNPTQPFILFLMSTHTMWTIYFPATIFKVMIYGYWRASGLVVASSSAGRSPPLFSTMTVGNCYHLNISSNEQATGRTEEEVEITSPAIPPPATDGTTPLFLRWLIVKRWPAVCMRCAPLG